MKKVFFFCSMILPLLSFASSQNANYNDSVCIDHGTISLIKYTEANTLEVSFKDATRSLTLYTDRKTLFALLFSAYMNQTTMEVYTNSCENEGGFSTVTFFRKT